MKLLVKLNNDSELIGYETLALAFTLASFDHEVQLYFTGDTLATLQDSHSRLCGMVQSLDLYDLPKAWADFSDEALATLDTAVQEALNKDFDRNAITDKQAADFDGVLSF
ncbi:hypothetical protein B0181_02865 [Moraxella caviae]|uniref:Uncharacterized protein n=1 Tax=Moraxella caviae TaxID=34060 RepID=A0A1T0A6Y0_9GAMM|nr:hypothetical protein [Moraxella caviae]OOR91515.1 hypothetical protein B0181_02865 [Moraxella caviae]STZ14399.1 Uncharacterised protein [Moraxella caviae]VEW10514.1 Uncharacterised protein [Moraxella caviae]